MVYKIALFQADGLEYLPPKVNEFLSKLKDDQIVSIQLQNETTNAYRCVMVVYKEG
ncbi:MAG TPA: sporulation protein Cse60 [Candidatus Nitrosocosmicus sp.]|nr:sporulation protein Cse60 [Candidatus Nitrosocosmicus sp.]